MLSKCKLCNGTRSKYLYDKNTFEVRKCLSCDVVYTVIPEKFNFDTIYNESYFQGGMSDGYNDYKGSRNVLHSEFSREVKLLRKYTSEHKTLLEIGSAYGFFLDVAKHYFEVDGIEIAQDAVDYAIRNGHIVYNSVLDSNLADKLGKRDIICMFDVIEHLPNPDDTFRIIDQIIEPNGLILLTTGNIDSIIAKLFGKNWRLMTPPQHTFFYSKNTLKYLLERYNYEVLFIDAPSKLVPIGLMFYQLYRITGLRLRYFEKFTNYFLQLNLFDTIRILARKKD